MRHSICLPFSRKDQRGTNIITCLLPPIISKKVSLLNFYTFIEQQNVTAMLYVVLTLTGLCRSDRLQYYGRKKIRLLFSFVILL